MSLLSTLFTLCLLLFLGYFKIPTGYGKVKCNCNYTGSNIKKWGWKELLKCKAKKHYSSERLATCSAQKSLCCLESDLGRNHAPGERRGRPPLLPSLHPRPAGPPVREAGRGVGRSPRWPRGTGAAGRAFLASSLPANNQDPTPPPAGLACTPRPHARAPCCLYLYSGRF